MANTLKQLGQAQLSNTGPTTIYTVPDNVTASIILDVLLCNNNTTTRRATMWFTVSGATRGIENSVLSGANILSGQTMHMAIKQILSGGGVISGLSSDDAESLTATITGLEQT